MALVSFYIATITLNVNGLNSPIKKHGVVVMDKKPRPNYMLPMRDSFQL